MVSAVVSYLQSRLSVCLIAGGVLALVCLPASAETVSDYARLLSESSQTLGTVISQEEEKPNSGTEAIRDLLGTLPKIVHVETKDAKTIDVNLTDLRDDLSDALADKGKDRVDDLRQALQRVQTLQAAMRAVPSVQPALLMQGKQTLARILSRRAYRPTESEDLWQKFWRWLFGGLSHVPGKAWDVVSWIFLVLVIIAFAVGLVLLALKLIPELALWRRRPTETRTHVISSPPIPLLASVIEAAEADAANGRYREAFRGFYLAAILALDRAGLVKYKDGVTNWEYQRAVAKQGCPETEEAFRPMTTSFDELIYGKRNVTSYDYLQFRERFNKLEGML